jgi:type IV secretion system protein VirD4
VVFYCDELGTLPAIESLELIFSASRSRRLAMVPIIQSFGQLEKNYGKEGSEIIVDNCQDTIFGGFAPNSQTAEVLSKALGQPHRHERQRKPRKERSQPVLTDDGASPHDA